MNAWKLRFLIGDCILTVLGIIFLIIRGSLVFTGMIIVGIVVFVIRVIWKPKAKPNDTSII